MGVACESNKKDSIAIGHISRRWFNHCHNADPHLQIVLVNNASMATTFISVEQFANLLALWNMNFCSVQKNDFQQRHLITQNGDKITFLFCGRQGI